MVQVHSVHYLHPALSNRAITWVQVQVSISKVKQVRKYKDVLLKVIFECISMWHRFLEYNKYYVNSYSCSFHIFWRISFSPRRADSTLQKQYCIKSNPAIFILNQNETRKKINFEIDQLWFVVDRGKQFKSWASWVHSFCRLSKIYNSPKAYET